MGGKKTESQKSRRQPIPRDGIRVSVPRPPQFDPCLTTRKRFRYLSTTNVSQPISWTNLMDSQIVATSTVTCVQMYDCVRIVSIEVWGASSQGSVTASVQFLGKNTGLQGDQKAYTDTACAVGEPLHIFAKPSKWSQAAQFQSGSSGAAFFIEVTSGSVIDLTLEFRNNYDATGVVSCANGVVGAVAGDFYYRGFDGLAVASTKFVPQGVIAIA